MLCLYGCRSHHLINSAKALKGTESIDSGSKKSITGLLSFLNPPTDSRGKGHHRAKLDLKHQYPTPAPVMPNHISQTVQSQHTGKYLTSM